MGEGGPNERWEAGQFMPHAGSVAPTSCPRPPRRTTFTVDTAVVERELSLLNLASREQRKSCASFAPSGTKVRPMGETPEQRGVMCLLITRNTSEMEDTTEQQADQSSCAVPIERQYPGVAACAPGSCAGPRPGPNASTSQRLEHSVARAVRDRVSVFTRRDARGLGQA